jgi:heat shock protein HslJ
MLRMNKPSIHAVVVLAVVVGCEKRADVASDYKDAEYDIDGRRIKLVRGVSEEEAAPGSASRILTRHFGNDIRHDLNGDGRADAVFLLTQETGGTGVFYYVVAALDTGRGYLGSKGLFVGDRIAPQTVEIGADNVVIVNYADRASSESFAIAPSVSKSIRLRLDPETLRFGEVVQDFEGEADPARMSLDMKTWTWIAARYADGRDVVPTQAGAYTLAFGADGGFSATTDCNRVGGSYAVSDDRLTFSAMFATKMYCAASQEGEFSDLLSNAASYRFTSRGELILSLEPDGGSVTFR